MTGKRSASSVPRKSRKKSVATETKARAKANANANAKAPKAKAPKPRGAKAQARAGGAHGGIPGPDRAVVDALDELLGGRRELRRGAMFGCPGYFLGAKAVACVFGSSLNLTLPADRVAALVVQPGYRPFVAGRGRAMSGWVLIDSARLEAMSPEDVLLEEAIAYARSKAEKGRPGRAARGR